MTELILEIRHKIAEQQFEFSKHAVDRSILRKIRVQEVREAIASGQIIEDYPQDKYGPSCLIFGFTQAKRPIHIQCTHPTRPLVKIVTVYEPNPEKWDGSFMRRRQSNNEN